MSMTKQLLDNEETLYFIFVENYILTKVSQNDEKYTFTSKDIFQKCLVLYPESVWNAQLDGLRCGLNQWNSKDQMMLRQFVADAEQVELDSQGRLLISKAKLQYAGIEGDVRFLAMVDRVEVWSKQMFEALMEQCDILGGEMEQRFGEKDGIF
jgi:MraZ protein